MEQAINLLVRNGMTESEAVSEINERIAYYMRGADGCSKRYATELVINEIIEWN